MRVTKQTNKIESFVRRHLGEPTDELRQEFIRWNAPYFAEHPTFWLEIGVDLLTAPPLAPPYLLLRISPDGLLDLGDGSHLIVGGIE